MSACVCVVSRAGARVTPEVAGSRYAEEAEEGGQEVEKDVRCQAVEGEGHDGPDGDDEGQGMESEKDGTCHGREEEEEAEEEDDDEEEDPEDEREASGQTLERCRAEEEEEEGEEAASASM